MWNWNDEQQQDDGEGESDTNETQQQEQQAPTTTSGMMSFLGGERNDREEPDNSDNQDDDNSHDDPQEKEEEEETAPALQRASIFSFLGGSHNEQNDQHDGEGTQHTSQQIQQMEDLFGDNSDTEEQDGHDKDSINKYGDPPTKPPSSSGLFAMFVGGGGPSTNQDENAEEKETVDNASHHDHGGTESEEDGENDASPPILAADSNDTRPSLFGFILGQQQQQDAPLAAEQEADHHNDNDDDDDHQNKNDDDFDQDLDASDVLPMAEIEVRASTTPPEPLADDTSIPEEPNDHDDQDYNDYNYHHDDGENELLPSQRHHPHDQEATSTASDDHLIQPKAKPKAFVLPNALPPPVSKNTRKCGLLIVGIGGGTGTMVLAGQLANQHSLSWESATGQVATTPNWNGCITQVPPRGVDGGVGFGGVYDLASATVMAISGWDINPTPLGDALYHARVVDYDLVTKVRDAMNELSFWPGIYNPSFSTARSKTDAEHNTHVLPYDSMTFLEQIEVLRQNIRSFQKERRVNGHTTVVWAATTERPAECEFLSGEELVDVVSQDLAKELDVAPSLLYAMAAAMEGCSFVMGNSHTRVAHPYSEALSELFMNRSQLPFDRFTMWSDQAPVSMERSYILGTTFSVGHSQLATASAEYVRLLGMSPRVLANSTCSGTGDQRQQAAMMMAKLEELEPMQRPKNSTGHQKKKDDDNNLHGSHQPMDMYAAWHEADLDHHSEHHYKPFLGNQHTQTVSTTSLGFLGCQHSMTVHTQCNSSAMTVPCIVDSAVWLDYFVYFNVPSYKVAQATAYLFTIPEGGAKGLDPGFSRQMQELERVLSSIAPKNKSPGWARMDRPGSDTASAEKESATRLANELFQKGVSANIIDNKQATKLRDMFNVLLLYYDY